MHEKPRRRPRIPLLVGRPVFRPRPLALQSEFSWTGQEEALREELLALLVQLQGAAPLMSVRLARQLAEVRDRLATLRASVAWLSQATE
jgi:hypothetical protein